MHEYISYYCTHFTTLQISIPRQPGITMTIILEPALSPWQKWLISFCHNRSVSWMGRRTALVARKLVLKHLETPVLAEIYGVRLRLFLRDNICERRFLFMPQFFDPFEFALIKAELPKDGVFIDIGANVGVYSLMASKSLGDHGKILAIEPNPITFDRLAANVALNAISADVSLEAVGVGPQEGTLMLTLHHNNLGQASANPDFEGEEISVPSHRLSTLLKRHNIQKIDILKIDIEGFEDEALIPFFTEANPGLFPRWIIIEKSEHQWQSDLLECLKSKTYQLIETTNSNYIFKRN